MLKVLKNLTRKDCGLIVIALAFIVLQVWLDLKLPDYMSEITMLVQSEGSAMGEILTAGGKMLGCALGSLISAACVSVLAARVGVNFAANERETV